MTRLACSGNMKIDVESIELDRLGTSYTIDTLHQVQLSQSSANLVLILGVDAFNGFLFWEGWEEILDFCNLFIVSRPAVAIDPNVLESTGLVDRRVSDPEALFLEETGFYFYCADVNMTYASSEVRQKLVKSETLDYAMNLTVLEYIDNHSLYTL
jgi:nicotinate-nucleotide adenylyltransferase